MACDYRELDKWVKRLKNTGKWTKARKEIVDDLANRLLALAKKRTPVGVYPKGTGKVGGNLKRNWATESKESKNSYEVTVFNDTDYASYVEYGHRTRNKKGWVEGRFMLSKSEVELAKGAEKFVRKKLDEFLEEVFNQ